MNKIKLHRFAATFLDWVGYIILIGGGGFVIFIIGLVVWAEIQSCTGCN